MTWVRMFRLDSLLEGVVSFECSMLTIRLQRVGRKKVPSYRLVISENARDTQGRSLEILGQYNPVSIPKVVSLNTDRIRHWLSVGATTSEAVHNLFVREGIVEDQTKRKAVSISKKRQAKLDEKKAAAEEAKRQAEEAAKAAEEAARVAAEEATSDTADSPSDVSPEDVPSA